MIDSASPFALDDAAQARRDRAKARLYVGLQTAGWTTFFLVQGMFTFLFREVTTTRAELVEAFCMLVVISAVGLLLTHQARRIVTRWGWKQRSWLALVPRIFGLALVLAVTWTAVGFTVHHFVTVNNEPPKYAPAVLFGVSTVNCTAVLVGWFCIYFFYHLFDRFNQSEIERLRLANVVKETELRALKSQVNPHFIFNSLNSVRALIDEDPHRARQAVTQLANLLRYSLQSGQLESVPFEHELAVVNDYLALEQVRHEERLRLRLDVAPETLHVPVPTMVLQTLVENAIKYGIAVRPAGGEITISTRLNGPALHLRVTNPGLLYSVAGSSGMGSTGVGLRNATSRLQLLFGERSSLRLFQSGPDEVTAEVVLPLEVEEALATPPIKLSGPRRRALA